METQLSTSFYCLNLERYQRYPPFCRPSRLSPPCIITGEQFRPDMLLSTANNILYIIELTVGLELILIIMQVENMRNTVTLYKSYHLITIS